MECRAASSKIRWKVATPAAAEEGRGSSAKASSVRDLNFGMSALRKLVKVEEGQEGGRSSAGREMVIGRWSEDMEEWTCQEVTRAR